jgi:hypothetical protein
MRSRLELGALEKENGQEVVEPGSGRLVVLSL